MDHYELLTIIVIVMLVGDALYGVPIGFGIGNLLSLIFAIPLYLIENLASSAVARDLRMFAISGVALYYCWDFVKKNVRFDSLLEVLVVLFVIGFFLH